MSQVVTELVIDADTTGADKFSQSMDKAAASSQQGISSAAGMTLAIAGVGVAFVAALAGLRSFYDYVGTTNKALIDIAENARNAGMTAKQFQETLFAARAGGLTEKDFVSGLDKIGADLTAASRGVTDFGRLFEQNGVSIRKSNGDLKNTKDALADIAGLMQKATPDIQQGVAKIVGLSKDWVPFLREGADTIEQQKKAATDLGIVISDDVIAKAKEFDVQWRTAIAVWDTQFKSSLTSILPLMVQLAGYAAQIIESVGAVSNFFSSALTADDQKSKSQLNDQIESAFRLRQMLIDLNGETDSFKAFKAQNLFEALGLHGPADIKALDDLITKLSAFYDKSPAQVRIAVPSGGTTLPPANDNNDVVDRAINTLKRHQEQQKADTEAVGLGAGALARFRAEAAETSAIQANGGKITADQVAQFEKLKVSAYDTAIALEKAKVASQIEFGSKTAFLSPQDVQIAQQLRGIYGNDVPEALASSYAAALRFNDSLKTMGDTARSSATSFSNDLISGLGKGETAVESLHNAFKNLASSLTSGALKALFNGDLLSAAVLGIGAAVSAIFSANTSSSGEKWLKAQTEGMNSRLSDISQRSALIGVNTNTREGAIAAQDAQFYRERVAENKAGGQAMNSLLKVELQERIQLLKDWDQKDIDIAKANADAKLAIEKAAADRSLGYQNRLFAATNDFSTLEGQLAAFDRTALQDRAAELQAGGQAMVDLEAAQAAERLNVVKSYNEKIVADTEAAAKAQQDALNGTAKSIVDFVNSMNAGSSSTLSPTAQLAAAQLSYNTKLGLAQGGDTSALSTITADAQNLLTAARAVYASSTGYQSIFNNIQSQLLNLPNVQQTTDPAVQAMRDVLTAINVGNQVLNLINTTTGGTTGAVNTLNATAGGTTGAVNSGNSLLNLINGTAAGTTGAVNSGNAIASGQILPAVNAGNAAAVATALQQYFNQIDPSGNLSNLLNYTTASYNYTRTFLPAIQDTSASVNTNTVATKGAVDAAKGSVDAAKGSVDANNTLTGSSNTILSAIQGLQDAANTQLTLLKNALSPGANAVNILVTTAGAGTSAPSTSQVSFSYQMLTALYKIVVNTWAIAGNTRGLSGGAARDGGMASGGWITGGIPGVDSVRLASGNLGMPGEFVVRNAVAQANAAWLPTFNRTGMIPVPSFRGANDNGNAALLAEMKRMNDKIERLEAVIAGSDAMTRRVIEANGDKVADKVDDQTDKLASNDRNIARQRRVANG